MKRTSSGSTRRQFLAATALAAGGGATINFGASAMSLLKGTIPRARRRTPLGKDEPIRIGIIGPGGMGKGHIEAYLHFNQSQQEHVHVVALADCCSVQTDDSIGKYFRPPVDPSNPGRWPRQLDVECDVYKDYRDMLKRDDIHGVLIASPEHWHAQQTIDAIEAGKDVYCEKPMTLRLDEALAVREVQNANPDILVQVGTQKMVLPKYIEAGKLIKEGAIGHPTFSQTSYCRNSLNGEWLYYAIDSRIKPGETIDWDMWCGPLGPRPWNHEIYHRWRRYKDFSTGIIGDLLVHEVTPLMMSLDCGYPTHVVGTGGHYIDKAMENHDQVNIQVQFGPKDHTMIVAGSTCNDQGLETMIRGHKATMYLGSNNVVIRPQQLYVREEGLEPRTVECEDIGNDQNQLRLNWLKCMRTREPVVSPVEFATQVMAVVDLATRAMWTKKAFEFEPKTLIARAV